MLLKIFIGILLNFIMVSSVYSREEAVICAKYQKEYGWSHGYKVNAQILSGYELNTATTLFNYNALSKYVVIFWDQGEASVIELDFPFLTAIGGSGKDQQGRKWNIAKTSICF